jgi:hypothetical protein
MLTREEEVWLRAYCASVSRSYTGNGGTVREADWALEAFLAKFPSPPETGYRGEPVRQP